jgi:hypothetical protein
MHTKMMTWPLTLALVKLYRSLLAHRQPPVSGHIGPYGGSYVNLDRNDE